MDTSWSSAHLLNSLSEENYDRVFFAYRHRIKLIAKRVGVTNSRLYHDVLASTRPELISPPRPSDNQTMVGELIHSNARLLLRFVTDAEQDPTLSTYAVGLHEQLCRSTLDEFFKQTLGYRSGATFAQSSELHTRTNLIAHWVNLGYVELEDVRDHILQSLTLYPIAPTPQLNSLLILLKIAGATFAAYVDPSVMDHCCNLLKPSSLGGRWVATELAKVRVLISATQM